jgi:hypothetical protein
VSVAFPAEGRPIVPCEEGEVRLVVTILLIFLLGVTLASVWDIATILTATT